MGKIKAISLWQPWATAVIDGVKEIETRTHDRFKSLVGQRVWIHAAKKVDPNWVEMWREAGVCETVIERFQGMVKEGLPAGALLGTVKVSRGKWVESFPAEHPWWVDNMSEHACCDVRGKYCMELVEPSMLVRPISERGRQGIWTPEQEAIGIGEIGG